MRSYKFFILFYLFLLTKVSKIGCRTGEVGGEARVSSGGGTGAVLVFRFLFSVFLLSVLSPSFSFSSSSPLGMISVGGCVVKSNS